MSCRLFDDIQTENPCVASSNLALGIGPACLILSHVVVKVRRSEPPVVGCLWRLKLLVAVPVVVQVAQIGNQAEL